MTILHVKDKIGLGQLVMEAARDPAVRQKLMSYPTETLAELVDIPKGHQVQVVEGKADVSILMIPALEDLEVTQSQQSGERYRWPSEYDPASEAYIDPDADPLKAVQFALGDYLLKKCR